MNAPNGNVSLPLIKLTVGADKKFSSEFCCRWFTDEVAVETYTVTVTIWRSVKVEQLKRHLILMVQKDHQLDQPFHLMVTDDVIGYEITGGKLLSITPDVDQQIH